MAKPNTKEVYDIAIVGGGVTGFAAAMYAGRLALKTIIFSDQRGGVITTTDDVSNYPGFKKLTGIELAKKIEEHAMDYDIAVADEKVVKVKGLKMCFKLKTDSEKEYMTKTVIFATGTKWKRLNIPGEKEFENKGVHWCALCDGFAYKNKVVAVIGGADSSAKDALVLTQHAKKVYIIYRGEKIRPEPVNMVKVETQIKKGKIEIINNTNLKEIKGNNKDGVISVILDKEYKKSKELKLDGVFIAIGHIALSDLAKDLGVKLNQKGEIIINRNSETNVKGIYAAGDVGDTKFKQAITGVSEGVLAAYSAYEFVNENNFVCPTDSNKT